MPLKRPYFRELTTTTVVQLNPPQADYLQILRNSHSISPVTTVLYKKHKICKRFQWPVRSPASVGALFAKSDKQGIYECCFCPAPCGRSNTSCWLAVTPALRVGLVFFAASGVRYYIGFQDNRSLASKDLSISIQRIRDRPGLYGYHWAASPTLRKRARNVKSAGYIEPTLWE